MTFSFSPTLLRIIVPKNLNNRFLATSNSTFKLGSFFSVNPDLRKVNVSIKSYSWPNVIRKDVVQKITKFITSNSPAAILFGSKGSGRSTAIKHAIQELENVCHLSINLEDFAHSNFVAFLTQFYHSLNKQVADYFPDPLQLGPSTYNAIVSADPAFRDVLLQMTRDLKIGRYPATANFSSLRKMSDTSFDMTAEQSWDYICRCLHQTSKAETNNTLSNLETVLLFLESIGEYTESSLAYSITEGALQHFPTGEKSLLYFLIALKTIGKITKKSFVLTLYNAEILTRSKTMMDRGEPFLTRLLEVTQGFLGTDSSISTLLLTDDSLLVVRLQNLKHLDALSQVGYATKKTQADAHNTFVSQHKYIPIEYMELHSWPKTLCEKIFVQRVSNEQKIFEAVYDSVGGHPKTLKCIADGLYKTDIAFRDEIEVKDSPLVKELSQSSIERFDFDQSAIVNEKIAFERLRRQQLYIRHMITTELPKDLLSFQWKMNQLLSLSLIQRLRQTCKTQIAFFVTLFESIRYFLSQEYWLLEEKQITSIANPVIIGLLDVKAISIKRTPTLRLEPYNRLHHHLLCSFINEKLEQLSLVNRIKYNITYLENSRDIRHRVKNMTIPW